MSRSNQEQRKILSFARRHGDAAACDAFEVSPRTLRRWRKVGGRRFWATVAADAAGGGAGGKPIGGKWSLFALFRLIGCI